jgi:hypothetical protein
MGPHGTGLHGPFSVEGRTDPPLDRTGVGYGTVHGPVQSTVTVWSGTGWIVRSISNHQAEVETTGETKLVAGAELIYHLCIYIKSEAMGVSQSTKSLMIHILYLKFKSPNGRFKLLNMIFILKYIWRSIFIFFLYFFCYFLDWYKNY